jgi:hypothetical protein
LLVKLNFALIVIKLVEPFIMSVSRLIE